MTRLRLLLLAFCLFCFASSRVHAAGSEFTVIPDATGSQATSYFQYELKPNTSQKLAVTIQNMADHPRKFALQFLSAGVSANGQLLYTPGAKVITDDGPSLQDMIQHPQTSVTIPARSSKTVVTTLNVPNTSWAGERLGSWYVQVASEKSSAAIQNRFAMAIPVHLTIAHALTEKPNLTLSQLKLDQSTVVANLTNHTPRLFGHITQTTRLYSPDRKVLAKQVLNNAQMAPSAIMGLQLPVKKTLTPGTYTFDLVLTSGQQRYHLTRTFAINADQIPTTKTQTQTTSLPWWVYLLIGLVIIMFGMIIWLFNTRKKNENTPNDFSDR